MNKHQTPLTSKAMFAIQAILEPKIEDIVSRIEVSVRDSMDLARPYIPPILQEQLDKIIVEEMVGAIFSKVMGGRKHV